MARTTLPAAPAASTALPTATAATPGALPGDATDLALRREVGRALLWSGEPAKALEALAPVHRARPWDREVQHLMLDALGALGRTAGDYPWTLEPTVVRLGASLLDELASTLRGNAGPATVLDLMLAVVEQGYPTFTARQLAAALEGDRRFRVHRTGLAPEGAVVARTPIDRAQARRSNA